MNLNSIGGFFGGLGSRFGSGYFFAPPADSLILWVYFGLYLTLLVFVLGYYFILRSRAKAQRAYVAYMKAWLWPNVSLAILGLLLVFFRYEQIAVLSWRFWMYILLAVIVTYEAWFFVACHQVLCDEIDKEADRKRKGKWLPKAKKKH